MTDDVLRDALRGAAEDYADLAEVETLIGAALARRDWRRRRAADPDRACAVCGGPIAAPKRADAEVCSETCSQRRKRARRSERSEDA